MKKSISQLIAAARRARALAYAPYSKYKVGAAVLTSDGEVFTGCNVENASYGLSQCAERVAIAKMVSAGKRKIAAIAVSGAGRPSPCGACRQVVWEFGPNAKVILAGAGKKPSVKNIAQLLPQAFRLKK